MNLQLQFTHSSEDKTIMSLSIIPQPLQNEKNKFLIYEKRLVLQVTVSSLRSLFVKGTRDHTEALTSTKA